VASANKKRLAAIFQALPEGEAKSLLDYAEFLYARVEKTTTSSSPAPADIPRPERESVVKAIKRLAATYPMVDRAKMLNETSVLMSQHVIQGRDAVEVIDELEILFRTHYERLQNK
jgi:hypothetical protein